MKTVFFNNFANMLPNSFALKEMSETIPSSSVSHLVTEQIDFTGSVGPMNHAVLNIQHLIYTPGKCRYGNGKRMIFS